MTADQWADFLVKVASIIIGSIPGVAAVLIYLLRMTRRMDIYLIEHEMLMSDLAFRAGKKLSDFPTRSRQH